MNMTAAGPERVCNSKRSVVRCVLCGNQTGKDSRRDFMMRTDEKRPRRICFLCRPAQGRTDPAGAELEAARTGLAGMGFSCRIIRTGSPGQAAAAVRDMEETLFVTDSAEILAALREQGKNAAGYLHGGNLGESFPGADYLIQEPGWIDARISLVHPGNGPLSGPGICPGGSGRHL